MFDKLLEKFKARPAGSGATEALENWGKTEAAIEREREKLQALLPARLEAEHEVVEQETAAALGEKATPDAGRKKLADAMRKVDRQSDILRGLRTRLAGFAAELGKARRAVKEDLPQHQRDVIAGFKEEWAEGIRQYGELLGRRQALEELLGEAMDLAEPRAIACSLPPDVAGPYDTLERLVAAIQKLERWRKASNDPYSPLPGAPASYDPGSLHQLQAEFDGLPAGALVVDATFAPGVLRSRVAIRDAYPAALLEWDAALRPAAPEARQIMSEIGIPKPQKPVNDGRVDFKVAAMYPDLSPEEYAERTIAKPTPPRVNQ